MKRIMFTYRDPLTNAPCVRWFRNIVSGRKYIRSLCFTVPYKVTIDDDNEFRGCYEIIEDTFIEHPKFGRVEIDGEVYDDKNI